MKAQTPKTSAGPKPGTNPKDLLGVKKCPLRLVPPALEIIAAPAMAEGAAKYGSYNLRGNKVQYSIYLEAIKRHLLALMDREDITSTGVHHLSHIAANVGIVADAMYGDNLIDDRPPAGPAPKMLAEQDKTAAKGRGA